MKMRSTMFGVGRIQWTSRGLDKLSTFQNCEIFYTRQKNMKQLASFKNSSRLSWKIISLLLDHIFNANHLIFTDHGISTLQATLMIQVRSLLCLSIYWFAHVLVGWSRATYTNKCLEFGIRQPGNKLQTFHGALRCHFLVCWHYEH